MHKLQNSYLLVSIQLIIIHIILYSCAAAQFNHHMNV